MGQGTDDLTRPFFDDSINRRHVKNTRAHLSLDWRHSDGLERARAFPGEVVPSLLLYADANAGAARKVTKVAAEANNNSKLHTKQGEQRVITGN